MVKWYDNLKIKDNTQIYINNNNKNNNYWEKKAAVYSPSESEHWKGDVIINREFDVTEHWPI